MRLKLYFTKDHIWRQRLTLLWRLDPRELNPPRDVRGKEGATHLEPDNVLLPRLLPPRSLLLGEMPTATIIHVSHTLSL